MKYESDGELPGLKPAGYDKHGPYYSTKQVNEISLADTKKGILIPLKEKFMASEINKASTAVEEAKTKFDLIIAALVATEAKASSEARKASGNIRKACDDLASGLIKVQKTADFASLERHVSLLERAAVAMTTLAELDKQGRLESMLKAMK